MTATWVRSAVGTAMVKVLWGSLVDERTAECERGGAADKLETRTLNLFAVKIDF